MQLPRGLEEMIDDYVADALDATGTRKTRTINPRRAATPAIAEIEIDVSDMADEQADARGDDELIPVEVDDRTDPEAMNIFSFDEGTAWMAAPFHAPKEALPTLSRVRVARGSQPPPAELEVDDEITNVLPKPNG